jgi:hypothetical protein
MPRSNKTSKISEGIKPIHNKIAKTYILFFPPESPGTAFFLDLLKPGL